MRHVSGAGCVRTVRGDVDPAAVGPAMVHEHVLFDIVPPGTAGDRDEPITLANRWRIDYLSNAHPTNAHQRDVDVAAGELVAFAAEGGSLIVDQSTAGLARDPRGLSDASLASGVHVVAAAGTYTAAYLDAPTCMLDVDALTERFVAEVTTGLDGTDVRAGLIGEIGCSWPLEPVERRALVAAARAARATGAAISVHPGRHPDAAHEILDVLGAEGADPSRVAICHMDRTYPDGDGVAVLLERGACVEWDFFGIETSRYWMADLALPTDRQRLHIIGELAGRGHADRLLVSQDVCTRTRLARWGGHGYGHVLRDVVPLMRSAGFDAALIDALVRGNPLRLLTLVPPIDSEPETPTR